MSFSERERKRLIPLKPSLFSEKAAENGNYNGKPYDFCLHEDHSEENLYQSIREEAISYFSQRKISWHDSIDSKPGNHLCCSQSFCINSLFPFIKQPFLLKKILLSIGYPAAEVLPFEEDEPLPDGTKPYIAFEWIGKHNYLNETRYGSIATDLSRSRGKGFTSADFALRFKRVDGRIQIILGEWKYTESYDYTSIRFNNGSTDRLGIYREQLTAPDSPFNLPHQLSFDTLFFDPFDQLMRLQLLANAMERAHEMDADIVTVLHVVPEANKDLTERITSPALSILGYNIHHVWANVVRCGKFTGLYTEDIIGVITKFSPDKCWSDYMHLRYGAIQ